MKDLLLGLVLFIIAFCFVIPLGAIFIPIVVVYYLVTLKPSKIGRLLHKMALSLDQFANVMLSTPLNWLMIRKTAPMKFGDEDDTLSYVIAVNYYVNNRNLTRFGMFWAKFLVWVDFRAKKNGLNHLSSSIRLKRLRDLQAYERVMVNDYPVIV